MKYPCQICARKTNVVFNIEWVAVPICEKCSRQIVLQDITEKYTVMSPLSDNHKEV